MKLLQSPIHSDVRIITTASIQVTVVLIRIAGNRIGNELALNSISEPAFIVFRSLLSFNLLLLLLNLLLEERSLGLLFEKKLQI